MTKVLTVVFPYFVNKSGETFLLMGRNRKLNKLNGFGGKALDGESVEDCARRELKEEIDLELENETEGDQALKSLGKIIDGEKEIYFFIYKVAADIFNKDLTEINAAGEVYDVGWRNMADSNSFLGEMLSGDEVLIAELKNIIPKVEMGEDFTKFEINKTGNEVLREQTKGIYR